MHCDSHQLEKFSDSSKTWRLLVRIKSLLLYLRTLTLNYLQSRLIAALKWKTFSCFLWLVNVHLHRNIAQSGSLESVNGNEAVDHLSRYPTQRTERRKVCVSHPHVHCWCLNCHYPDNLWSAGWQFRHVAIYNSKAFIKSVALEARAQTIQLWHL